MAATIACGYRVIRLPVRSTHGLFQRVPLRVARQVPACRAGQLSGLPVVVVTVNSGVNSRINVVVRHRIAGCAGGCRVRGTGGRHPQVSLRPALRADQHRLVLVAVRVNHLARAADKRGGVTTAAAGHAQCVAQRLLLGIRHAAHQGQQVGNTHRGNGHISVTTLIRSERTARAVRQRNRQSAVVHGRVTLDGEVRGHVRSVRDFTVVVNRLHRLFRPIRNSRIGLRCQIAAHVRSVCDFRIVVNRLGRLFRPCGNRRVGLNNGADAVMLEVIIYRVVHPVDVHAVGVECVGHRIHRCGVRQGGADRQGDFRVDLRRAPIHRCHVAALAAALANHQRNNTVAVARHAVRLAKDGRAVRIRDADGHGQVLFRHQLVGRVAHHRLVAHSVGLREHRRRAE